MERRRSRPRGEGPIMREQDIPLAPDYGARFGPDLRNGINPYVPGDLAPQTLEMQNERGNHDLGAAVRRRRAMPQDLKSGGAVKMKSGGVTRGDGCAARGKTKGRMV